MTIQYQSRLGILDAMSHSRGTEPVYFCGAVGAALAIIGGGSGAACGTAIGAAATFGPLKFGCGRFSTDCCDSQPTKPASASRRIDHFAILGPLRPTPREKSPDQPEGFHIRVNTSPAICLLSDREADFQQPPGKIGRVTGQTPVNQPLYSINRALKSADRLTIVPAP